MNDHSILSFSHFVLYDFPFRVYWTFHDLNEFHFISSFLLLYFQSFFLRPAGNDKYDTIPHGTTRHHTTRWV